jgi:hypothetical protein
MLFKDASSTVRRLRRPWSRAGRSRPALISGAVVAAAGLVLGSASAASGAATLAAGWHSFTPPIGDGLLYDIYAPSVTDAWAVGESASGGSVYLHFNGSAWSSVSGPALGPVGSVSGTSDSDLWVLGTTGTAHYNGSTWQTYPLYLPAGATYVPPASDVGADQQRWLYAAGPDDVYATVNMTVPGQTASSVLEHFNGTAWSQVTGAPNLTTGTIALQVSGSGPDNVYVAALVGIPDYSGELLHYNGTSWSVVSLPEQNSAPPELDYMQVTGAGKGLDTADGYIGKVAKLSGGKWGLINAPLSNVAVNGSGSGTGRVFAEFVTANAAHTLSLWQWSAGKWQRITPDDALGQGTTDSGIVDATANGGGFWSFNVLGSFGEGSGVQAQTELYVAS